MSNYEKLNAAMNDLKDDELKLVAPFLKGLALHSHAVSCEKDIELETFVQLFNTLSHLVVNILKVDISNNDEQRYQRLLNAKLALIETLVFARNDAYVRMNKKKQEK